MASKLHPGKASGLIKIQIVEPCSRIRLGRD